MMLSTFGNYGHVWLLLIGLLHVGVAQLYEDDPCITHDNSNGICKVLQDCDYLTNLIRQNKMKLDDPKRCGFKGSLEIVCCPSNEVLPSTPKPVVKEPYIEKRQVEDTTVKTVDFWEPLLATTAEPDFWLPFLSTTTTTTTTTTPRPLVFGDQKLDTNSEFFDLSEILNSDDKPPGFENTVQGVNNQQHLIANGRGSRLVSALDGPQIQEVNQGFVGQNGDTNRLGLNRPNVPMEGANNGFVNGNIGFGSWPGNGNGYRVVNGPGVGRGNGFGNRPGHGRAIGLGNGHGHGFGNGRGNGNGHSRPGVGIGFGNGRGHGLGHSRGSRDAFDLDSANQMGFQNGFVNGANQLQDATGQNQLNFQPHDQFVAQSQYPILQNSAITPGQQNLQPNNPLIAHNQNLFLPITAQSHYPILQNGAVMPGQQNLQLNSPLIAHNQNLFQPITAENELSWPTAVEPISTVWNNNNHVAIFQYDIDNAASNNYETPNRLRDQAPAAHNGPIWNHDNTPRPTRTPFHAIEQIFNNLANNGMDIVKAEPYEPHATTPFATSDGPVARSNPFLSNQVAQQPVRAVNPFLPNQVRPQPAVAINPFLSQPVNSHPDEKVLWPAHNTASHILQSFNRNPITTSTPKPKPQEPQVISSKTERPSIAACKIIEQNLLPSLTPHILDGTPVAPGEYPHMAAIGYENIGNEAAGYDIRCGGTLIHERFVLTAAHCVNSKNDKPAIVRLGISNFDDPDEFPHQVEIPVKNVHIHDNYTSAEKYNDIALLEMAQSVQFSNYIAPACLWSNMSDPGQNFKLYVSGWGTVNQKTRSRSRILLKAALALEPLERCNVSYVNFGLPRQLARALEDTQLCARDPDPGNTKDACQGDSGGPLNVVVDESTKNFHILGVISTGFGCATLVPGLYTRVGAYLDFIESKVWPQP